MKKNVLITTTAMALLASASFAFAQKGPENADRSSAPPAASSPSGGSMSQGATEKMAPSDKRGAATQKANPSSDRAAQSSGATEKMGQTSGTADKAAQRGAESTTGMENKNTKATTGTENKNTKADSTKSEKSAQSPSESTTRSTQTEKSTTDRNAAGSSSERNASTTSSQTNVQLSSDQRTKIRETVIKQSNAPRISRNEVNFSLNVGTVIPRSVHVAVLPETVIEIHPQWRGFQYVLVGDEIVILDPSLRIVAIIPA